MSSVKRWAEQNGLLEPRSQQEQDLYWDGDEKIGYRFNDSDLVDLDPPPEKVKFEIEMKKDDFRELETYLVRTVSSKSFPNSARATRLRDAIDIFLLSSRLK